MNLMPFLDKRDDWFVPLRHGIHILHSHGDEVNIVVAPEDGLACGERHLYYRRHVEVFGKLAVGAFCHTCDRVWYIPDGDGLSAWVGVAVEELFIYVLAYYAHLPLALYVDGVDISAVDNALWYRDEIFGSDTLYDIRTAPFAYRHIAVVLEVDS